MPERASGNALTLRPAYAHFNIAFGQQVDVMLATHPTQNPHYSLGLFQKTKKIESAPGQRGAVSTRVHVWILNRSDPKASK